MVKARGKPASERSQPTTTDLEEYIASTLDYMSKSELMIYTAQLLIEAHNRDNIIERQRSVLARLRKSNTELRRILKQDTPNLHAEIHNLRMENEYMRGMLAEENLPEFPDFAVCEVCGKMDVDVHEYEKKQVCSFCGLSILMGE